LRIRLASFLFLVVAVGGMLFFGISPLQVLDDLGSHVIVPLEETMSSTFGEGNDILGALREPQQLLAENEQLRAEVEELSSLTVRLEELERENEELLQQLKLQRADPAFERLRARVVARDPTRLAQAITVDRGSEHGIREGMTVVSPAGLVGRVVKVNSLSSKVLVITDVSSSITVIVQSSRAVGVVDGKPGPLLGMKFIGQGEVVEAGDVVITAGLGGVFPPGIAVGRVTSVSKRDVEAFQAADLEPAVDFSHLEWVLIITNHVPLKLE